MKQFVRYILTLVAMLMATTHLTAQVPNYQGGVWYSLYDTDDHTRTSKGDFPAKTIFTPAESMTFQYKKYTGISINGNIEVKNYIINSGWSGSKETVRYSSTSWTTSSTIPLDSAISQVRCTMTSGNGGQVRNHFVKLRKHILLNNGTSYGTTSLSAENQTNLATSVGVRSTNAYTIPLRSFYTTKGKITITSSNPEFHFSDGSASKTFTLPTTNFCASASYLGTPGNNWQNINNYQEKIYFTPSVNIKDTRSTTITISDGTSTAYINLSAPVIPTYFFKAAAYSSPAEGGTATATFSNGQDNCSVIATNYTTTSMSATVTFTAAPKTADGYVFEGWKKDPANATFHIQGADKTTIEETITSSALNPNGLASQLTLYAIYSRRYTAKITGSNYTNKLVNESWQADYQFVNTQTATPSNSDTDPFYFKIDHDFTGNDTREDSPRPAEVIAYDPITNTITALNEGTATITFYQKNTSSHEPVTESFTVQVIKHTPKFTWNTANTPYYYGTSIPNIFSTTNTDIESTFVSDNEAFARVENNTLHIANARETATITVSQKENYKWYSKTEQYPISPVNANNHVPFKIDTEAQYNTLKHHTESGCKWSNNQVKFEQGGFNWDDNYYDIHFEGIPDVVTFNYDADGAATGLQWYVQESNDGINWSDKLGHSTSNSGSASVTLQSSTRYLRFCYSGNLNGYISNIEVTERFQFEATPTAIDFGSEGITYGMQHDTVIFLHANAGRITKAVITGEDAKYFNVKPELIPGTGRDCYGNAALEVTFDNLGEDRGATPYNATLVISDNSDKTEDIHIPLTGIRDGKSTADIIWNPNALPYYFNTTIANIAYSTNRDANCPLTFVTTDTTIAEVKNGDLHIYNKGQEVTITVTQPGNADFMPATGTFTFTPCERPSLEVPFRVSQALHAQSVQLNSKCEWRDDTQIRIGDPTWDGFVWGDDRKRVLITFAGTPDKLYFEYSSSNAATPELATHGWEVEESPNGVDWNTVWKTGSLSASWKTSGEIDLSPNTQYIRFNYKGNFAGYLRNIIISSLEGNNYLRAEEGTYLSRGAKWGTQAVVDPFGMVCRVSHFTVDNTNIYTRLQFVDNMQYLYETKDTKEVFTDAETADNPAYLWQINSDASGKFTVQSANDLDNGNRGNYFTIIDNTLAFTSDPAQATVWHMETPAEHNNVVRSYMDAAAAKAAEKDFGSDINTLEKVRSNLYVQDFEITEITVPAVALAEQTGEYRDGINGTLAVYDDTISGLKPGFYRLTIKALYRISDSQKAQAAKTNGWESVLAYIYANDVKYPIQSVYTSYNAGSYDPSDEIYEGHYYPTQLNPSVEQAFTQDINRYLNDVYVYVEADPGQTTGTLRYGIKNPSYVPGAWLAYSTITLTHFGRKEYVFQGTDSHNPIDWHTPANWNRNEVPNQYHNVRIQANVNISSHVEVFGVTIDQDPNQNQDPKLHITSTGGLTVGAHGIQSATTDGSSIVIDNLPEGAGFLRVAPNATTPVTKVKVNYATEAYNSGNPRDEVWQYVGAPGAGMQMTNADNALIYHWNEQKGWEKYSGTSLEPFVGYALTQDQAPRGEFEIIATPIFEDKKIELTLTPNGMNGDNLFVNSYLSPIDVARIDPDSAYYGIEGTFYLFNSGSWKNWQADGGANTVLTGNSPGKYYAITPGSAALIDSNEDQTTIPPMQGAYVIAQTNDAWLKLNYKKHVYDVTSSSSMNRPMRAPQENNDDFMRVRLQVNSENSGADRMYVIQYGECTSGYDNGYDARNILAEGQANLYTHEMDGQMEISVSDRIDSTYIGFSAGTDTQYTLRMSSVVGELYLKDLETGTIISVSNGEEYIFYATPNSMNNKRFLLLDTYEYPGQGGVSTDIEDVNTAHIWVANNKVFITDAPINSDLVVYTINGMIVNKHKITTPYYTLDLSGMTTGVYVIRLNNQAYKFVCK